MSVTAPEIGHTEEAVGYVPMNRALVVVDMVDEFVHGRLGSEKSRAIVPACQRVLEHARSEGWPVAFTRDFHLDGDPELALWGEHSMGGTPGAQLIPELDANERRASERIFSKRAYSAFHNPQLEPWLWKHVADLEKRPWQEKGRQGVAYDRPANGHPTELVLVGTATHICVAQTAIEAFQLGFKIAVVSDATCGFMDTDDRAWLAHIAQLTGAWLPDSDALVRVTATPASPHHE